MNITRQRTVGMYAIRNKGTKEWLYGTDYREYPYKQRTSQYKAITFEDKEEAEWEFKRRQCNNDYAIIEVELRAISDWPPRLISPLDSLRKGGKNS